MAAWRSGFLQEPQRRQHGWMAVLVLWRREQDRRTLPEYIQNAAAGIGPSQRSYDYKVRYVGQVAQQCASITADQAGAVARLRPDYRPCAAPYGVPVPRHDGPPGPSHPAELLVEIRPQFIG